MNKIFFLTVIIRGFPCELLTYSFKTYMTEEKKIVVLTNQIVDIELTKLFCFPNKFSVFPTNLFVEPTKEFFISFFWKKFFVRRTKMLLRRQKKCCQFYIFLRVHI